MVPIRISPRDRVAAPTSMMPFQRPVRVMYCPLPVAPTRLPKMSGSISRPASVGVWSRATWKYWLRKTEAPN